MIKLDKVIECLDFTSIDMEWFYNPSKNEFFFSNLGAYDDLGEDEKEELLENSIRLPSQYEINEYAMMEDFTETIEDVRTYNQLAIALNGSGAFRRFKDTCINFEIINEWYKYRDKRYKNLAIEWCEDNELEFEE